VGERRFQAERQASLYRAGTQLATSASAYRRAAAAAGDDQNQPQWRALLHTQLERMEDATTLIQQPGDQPVIDASLRIVGVAFKYLEPIPPDQLAALLAEQSGAIGAYQAAVRNMNSKTRAPETAGYRDGRIPR
jgi:D-alanyl-D-alanine carboxypeptidase